MLLNLEITGVATSERTRILAEDLGITVVPISECDRIDIDVDGADEIDPLFNLIKGGGGAHTSEKRVAEKSDKFIVIADASKLVDQLGEFPVAVEVEAGKKESVIRGLIDLGGKPVLREGFITDRGNIVLDTYFDITDPLDLELSINRLDGVVENGIFASRRPEIVLVGDDSGIKIIENNLEREWI